MRVTSIVLLILVICNTTNVFSQSWKPFADSAAYYKEQKSYQPAIQKYNEALGHLAKDSNCSTSSVQLLKGLVECYKALKIYDSVTFCYKQILSHQHNLRGRDTAYASTADALSAFFYEMSDFQNAERYVKEAKEIKKSLLREKSPEIATSCTLLGAVSASLGKYEQAEQEYLQALEIRAEIEPKGQSTPYAQICNNLAELYRQLGDYGKAEPLVLQALEIRAKVPPEKQSRVYAITCTSVANLYRDMGQFGRAENYYLEAKSIRENLFTKNSREYTQSCNILADLYYFMRKFDQAEALYLEAKEIREKLFTKQSADYAQSCNNLAGLYRDNGLYEKAEAYALEAKMIWETILPKDHPSFAINFNNLGDLYCAKGGYKKAEEYYLKAREQWAKQVGKQHLNYLLNTGNLAKVYWNLSDLKKALELYQYQMTEQYQQINRFFQFTSEKEKQAFVSNINSAYDEFQSFCYLNNAQNKGTASFTTSLLNRNLILNADQQLRQTVYSAADTVLHKLFDEWKMAKQQIAHYHTKGLSPEEPQMKELLNKTTSLEKELARRSSSFKKSLDKMAITPQQLQQTLSPDEAAIEFVSFNFYNGKKWTDSTFYMALILRKNMTEPALVPLFESRELTAILSKHDSNRHFTDIYRGVEIESQAINTSKQLFNVVWQPLEKHLKGIKRIYFAPSGSLHRIAFTALPLNEKQLLSDKYQLVQLNTTAALLNLKNFKFTNRDKVLLYGGINYNADSSLLAKAIEQPVSFVIRKTRSLPEDSNISSDWKYLEGTFDEVSGIYRKASHVKANAHMLTGVKATEESFKALNGNQSPAILHVATHGFFFPDPKTSKVVVQEAGGNVFKVSDDPLFRSGLLFAGANNAWKGKAIDNLQDGIVTAYEVANMYLPNTKLAVLSACETALGDIQGSEGVYGLQRAFITAGVKNLVMSLWKVPDAETAEFMKAFYQQFLVGRSVSDAFYATQTQMKNKYRNEPFKWAAWILIR